MHVSNPCMSSPHYYIIKGADTHRPPQDIDPPNAVSALSTKLAFLFNFFYTINYNVLSNLAA